MIKLFKGVVLTEKEIEIMQERMFYIMARLNSTYNVAGIVEHCNDVSAEELKIYARIIKHNTDACGDYINEIADILSGQ